MKYFSRHIEFETLVRRAEAVASFDEAQAVHLADCKTCVSQMRKLENFFSVAKTEPATVPQFVTANLLNIYQQPKHAEKKSLAKRLFGSLVFDDWRPEFAVQERLSFLETRQLLYRADGYEIDLRLTFINGKCQVSGQIFPDCAVGVIKIFSDSTTAQIDLNEHCEFVLPLIEEGIYNLQAEMSGETIEIESLSLLQ